MNSVTTAGVMAPLVEHLCQMHDEKRISTEALRDAIHFSVELLDTYEEDFGELFHLVPDRCTRCFKKVPPAQLINWDDALDAAGGQASECQQRAYNNAFGSQMVGGTVCEECASTLPLDTDN